jgi:ATP-dependent DNA helicase RecQ
MDPLLDAVRKHWGFDALRPLQREAMGAALEGRDSLVVLPTGGGKSLCYQAPALLSPKLTVVVSPLISLMKDQVDRLLSRGVPAAFINSSLDGSDRGRVQAGIVRGEYRLLFVSPERFAAPGFDRLLSSGPGVGAFAIDEAHCISHWGHDFRQDYRELGRLKREFPDASVHAFTATATPRVREDIVGQLGLRDPALLVGDFFRPNLKYRVARRDDALEDCLREIRSRPGQAGIVYCIRRADVDSVAAGLRRARIRAAPYHAGMDDEARTRTQDRFAAGELDVVVATVAFGMGIDRADLRFVFHAAMPKSVEHYQQETGRAGRDGKDADCILFYSGQDYQLWKSIIEKNETTDAEAKLRMLSEMYGFCTGGRCRHRRLVEYFGQAWTAGACGACDVCEGTAAALPGAADTARQILSCVAATGQRYGGAYVAEVLTGEETERVRQRGHAGLELFGLLRGRKKGQVFGWIDQLVERGLLAKEAEYGVLQLTASGVEALRGDADAVLYGDEPARRPSRKRRAAEPAPLEADGDPAGTALFERLRAVRRAIAERRGIPAFMVFSDRTLREMARLRPASRERLLQIHGVGLVKLADFGGVFLDAIRGFKG